MKNETKINEIINSIKNKNYSYAETELLKLVKTEKKKNNLLNLLSIVYIEQNRISKAVLTLTDLIINNPNYQDAIENICTLIENKIPQNEGEQILNNLICIAPNNYRILSVFLINQIDNPSKSLGILKKLIKINNKDSLVFLKLGLILLNKLNIKLSLKCFNKAIEINPNHDSAYVNLAYINSNYLNNYNEAISLLKKALNINNKNISAYSNLGKIFREMGNNSKANYFFDLALKIDPKHLRTNYNLGLYFLSIGDYKNGWPKYELREKIINKSSTSKIKLKKNIWDGLNNDKKLIVYAEQGVGDEIIISSVFNDLKKIHKDIEITCDKRLKTIFTRSFSNIKFTNRDQEIDTNNNYFINSFSLGKILRNKKSDFNLSLKSWISTDKIKDKKIAAKFSKNNKIKIGISWYSSGLAKKNIDLENLCKAIPLNNFELINLQYSVTKIQIDNFYKKTKRKIKYFDDISYKNDIDDLLSIISNCDLVVTIDNATAQFAGCIGKPTYLLTSINPMWYWGLQKQSNWVPCIEIIRQKKFSDWSYPLDYLNIKLKELERLKKI